MKIGVVYPQIELGGDPEALHRFGLAVESLGYDHLLVYDHVVGASHDREPKLWGPYTDKDPFHDPFVMFGYLAGITKRIELVTGVLILPQRQTALVAKQATDVDLMSRQRLRLGVGIGWNYVEYDSLGQDFTTRGKRADEQIGLLRRLWTEPLITFEGKFDRIDRACIIPRPKRLIPIWIGGFADAAFRRGGHLGDGYIFASGTPGVAPADHFEHLKKGVARIDHFRKEAGRDNLPFGRELQIRYAKNPAEIASTIKQWQALGGTHVSIRTMDKDLGSVDAHIDYMTEVRHHVTK